MTVKARKRILARNQLSAVYRNRNALELKKLSAKQVGQVERALSKPTVSDRIASLNRVGIRITPVAALRRRSYATLMQYKPRPRFFKTQKPLNGALNSLNSLSNKSKKNQAVSAAQFSTPSRKNSNGYSNSNSKSSNANSNSNNSNSNSSGRMNTNSNHGNSNDDGSNKHRAKRELSIVKEELRNAEGKVSFSKYQAALAEVNKLKREISKFKNNKKQNRISDLEDAQVTTSLKSALAMASNDISIAKARASNVKNQIAKAEQSGENVQALKNELSAARNRIQDLEMDVLVLAEELPKMNNKKKINNNKNKNSSNKMPIAVKEEQGIFGWLFGVQPNQKKNSSNNKSNRNSNNSGSNDSNESSNNSNSNNSNDSTTTSTKKSNSPIKKVTNRPNNVPQLKPIPVKPKPNAPRPNAPRPVQPKPNAPRPKPNPVQPKPNAPRPKPNAPRPKPNPVQPKPNALKPNAKPEPRRGGRVRASPRAAKMEALRANIKRAQNERNAIAKNPKKKQRLQELNRFIAAKKRNLQSRELSRGLA